MVFITSILQDSVDHKKVKGLWSVFLLEARPAHRTLPHTSNSSCLQAWQTVKHSEYITSYVYVKSPLCYWLSLSESPHTISISLPFVMSEWCWKKLLLSESPVWSESPVICLRVGGGAIFTLISTLPSLVTIAQLFTLFTLAMTEHLLSHIASFCWRITRILVMWHQIITNHDWATASSYSGGTRILLGT